MYSRKTAHDRINRNLSAMTSPSCCATVICYYHALRTTEQLSWNWRCDDGFQRCGYNGCWVDLVMKRTFWNPMTVCTSALLMFPRAASLANGIRTLFGKVTTSPCRSMNAAWLFSSSGSKTGKGGFISTKMEDSYSCQTILNCIISRKLIPVDRLPYHIDKLSKDGVAAWKGSSRPSDNEESQVWVWKVMVNDLKWTWKRTKKPNHHTKSSLEIFVFQSWWMDTLSNITHVAHEYPLLADISKGSHPSSSCPCKHNHHGLPLYSEAQNQLVFMMSLRDDGERHYITEVIDRTATSNQWPLVIKIITARMSHWRKVTIRHAPYLESTVSAIGQGYACH